MRVPMTVIVTLGLFALGGEAAAANGTTAASILPWWAWVLLLLGTTFVLGIIAVLGGIGGGILFVPLVGGLFPFHWDFVRGAELVVALAGALAAGPGLLRGGMASLRLAMPLALTGSVFAIIGAKIGLMLPERVAQLTLGTIIVGVVAVMVFARKADYPEVAKPDSLASALRIHGIYHEPFSGQDIDWTVHRTPQGFALFSFIGLIGGMFGIGAGWANVPVLNLVMGAPLKVSVGTSSFILSIVNSTAAWVYLNEGAMLAIIVVPSMLGIMLGTLVGVGLLSRSKPALIRKIVTILLVIAGVRALVGGLFAI